MKSVLCVMILTAGAVMTFYTGGVQRQLGKGLKRIFGREKGEGLSSFGVLCTTLAATLGTGNIVGVATAVAIGGAGALFWMVAASLAGMAIKYAECLLAVQWRRPCVGGYEGGPFYYIAHALGSGWAKLFAFCGAAAGALGFGTLTQVDGIARMVREVADPAGRYRIFSHISVAEIAAALLTALLAGAVLWGGLGRISAVCETVVPVMAVGYVVCCGVILFRFREALPQALLQVVQGAFCPQAVGGGLWGTISVGVSRGIFSNEAGLGSTPIAAAAAKDGDAVGQGLLGMASVFIDTTLMCPLSGLCLVVTGAAWRGEEGAAMTADAFTRGLGASGAPLLSIFLCCFAFSTIIGWYYYAQRCMIYLCPKGERAFRWFYIFMLSVAPFVSTGRIWSLADALNTGMALPNLLALLVLRRQLRFPNKR